MSPRSRVPGGLGERITFRRLLLLVSLIECWLKCLQEEGKNSSVYWRTVFSLNFTGHREEGQQSTHIEEAEIVVESFCDAISSCRSPGVKAYPCFTSPDVWRVQEGCCQNEHPPHPRTLSNSVNVGKIRFFCCCCCCCRWWTMRWAIRKLQQRK